MAPMMRPPMTGTMIVNAPKCCNVGWTRLHPKVPSYAMWVIMPIRSSSTSATPAATAPTTTDRSRTGHTGLILIVKSPSDRSAAVRARPWVSSSPRRDAASSPGGDSMVPGDCGGGVPPSMSWRPRNARKRRMPLPFYVVTRPTPLNNIVRGCDGRTGRSRRQGGAGSHGSGGSGGCGEGRADLRGVFPGRVPGVVTAARPQPEPQAILPAARYDVQVQVGDGLADHVVDQDHRAIGCQAVLHRALKALRGAEELVHAPGGQIAQQPDVEFRDEQRVPVKQWPVVEECDQAVVLADHLRLHLPPYDGAERARRSALAHPASQQAYHPGQHLPCPGRHPGSQWALFRYRLSSTGQRAFAAARASGRRKVAATGTVTGSEYHELLNKHRIRPSQPAWR